MIKKPTSQEPGESSPDNAPSPLETLLEQVRSSLAARRLEGLRHVQEVEAALAAYRRSVEEALALEFARDHRLRAPRLLAQDPRTTARRLRDAVLALPDLAPTTEKASLVEPSPVNDAARLAPSSPSSTPASQDLPRLTDRATHRKLVVIGAMAGRRHAEAFPPHLQAHTEWVDTESGGVHAVGNLPQRIRQGRVAALLILDRAVQHKHTEPLVSAARAAAVPVGFAGKGGGASLRRALESIEEQLARRGEGAPPNLND